MYALHPGSLPPEDPKSQVRREVTAADLVKLYKLDPHDYIVWDPRDGYDWFDFIHLYPSYYGRYTLLHDGTPPKDVPCGFTFSTTSKGGTSGAVPVTISTRRKR